MLFRLLCAETLISGGGGDLSQLGCLLWPLQMFLTFSDPPRMHPRALTEPPWGQGRWDTHRRGLFVAFPSPVGDSWWNSHKQLPGSQVLSTHQFFFLPNLTVSWVENVLSWLYQCEFKTNARERLYSVTSWDINKNTVKGLGIIYFV